MKLTKNTIASLIAVAVIITVFNVIAFAAPFTRGGTFWAGYIFLMIALLLTAGVGLYALGREGLKSKFYGVSLVHVAWAYLVAQIILGFVFMAIAVIPAWVAVIVGVVLLGGCVVGLIAVDLGKDEIERIDKKVREKVFYIKSLQADIEMIADKTDDAALKKTLKDLAETIKYSDPMSNDALAAIENNIEDKAAELRERVAAGNVDGATALCDELQQLFAERNRKAKLLK
jgi:signal transduction histidine kinase